MFMALFLFVLFGRYFGNLFDVLQDSDSCWLIQTGLRIVQQHALPLFNPFSGGDPVLGHIPIVCYQWLFEVMLGVSYRALGLPGVGWFIAACFALTYAVLTLWLYRRGVKAVPDLLVCLLISLMSLKSYALARPPLMTLLFSALLLWFCSMAFSRRKAWLVFPLLFLFWANLHLGFIAGLMIFALRTAERAWQEKSWQPVYLWLACVVVTFVNPYGPQVFAYFYQLANSPFMNHHIYELGSPPFNVQPMFLVYFLLMMLAAFFAFRDARIGWSDKVFFGVSLALSLYSMRHIFLLVLASLPLLAVAIEGLRKRCPSLPATFQAFSFNSFTAERERPWLWIVMMLILGLVLAQQIAYTVQFPQETKLSGVVRYIRQHSLPGPLLSNEIWGSYLIFFTNKRSYLDSRMDMYGDAWVKRMADTISLEGNWRNVFQQYRFRYVLLSPASLQFRYLHGACRAPILYQDAYTALLNVESLSAQCQ
jgi:hypothetical protein